MRELQHLVLFGRGLLHVVDSDQLAGGGLDDENHITLTDTGRTIAERIYERHNVIAAMLIGIGVSEETAYSDACKIEHDLSDETFECVKAHFNKYMSKQGEKN